MALSGFKRLAYGYGGRRVRRRVGGSAARSLVARRMLARRALMYGGGVAAAGLATYGAYKGIRRIRAARARRIKRRKLGYNYKRSPKTRLVVDTGPTNKTTRFLQNFPLTQITKGTAQDNREADSAMITGWKIQLELTCTHDDPIYVNFAVVSPKGWSHNTSGSFDWTKEFFRDYGPERAKDFSISEDSLNLIYCPINTDQFVVLHRWRVVLGNRKNNATSETLLKDVPNTPIKYINKWVPFKRSLRYESTSSAEPETDPVFLVYWGDQNAQAGGTVSLGNAWKQSTKIITYFKDNKS